MKHISWILLVVLLAIEISAQMGIALKESERRAKLQNFTSIRKVLRKFTRRIFSAHLRARHTDVTH